jgi:hypothetical protein
MTQHRYFGTVAAHHGALVVRRDDDGSDAFLGAREAAKAGVGLQAGDRIEFSIAPGGAAVDVMLCAYSGERHHGPRVLPPLSSRY